MKQVSSKNKSNCTRNTNSVACRGGQGGLRPRASNEWNFCTYSKASDSHILQYQVHIL